MLNPTPSLIPMLLLVVMLVGGDLAKAVAATPKGMEMVVAGMRQHADHEGVQEHCCVIFVYLLKLGELPPPTPHPHAGGLFSTSLTPTLHW